MTEKGLPPSSSSSSTGFASDAARKTIARNSSGTGRPTRHRQPAVSEAAGVGIEGESVGRHAHDRVGVLPRHPGQPFGLLARLAQGLLRSLDIADVHEGDDDPFDPVVRGAIGRDAADVPAAVLRLDFLGERGQVGQDAGRVAEQGLVLEPAQDVRDGPGQVAWDQAEKPGAGRGVPLDLELFVQEHRGDGRAFEQVEQVVVDALELLDLVLKAGIDGVELLVQGLELLLGGLELLVGGLELFIGRGDFLVGGLELVVRALELGDRALKLLAGDLQFVLELLELVLPFGGPDGLRRRGEAILESDQKQAVGLAGEFQGADRGRDGNGGRAAPDAGFDRDRAVGFEALGDGRAQPGPQAFPGHVHDPGGQLAGRKRQVLLDRAVNIKHLELAVDDHAGGGEAVQDELLGHRGQALPGRGERPGDGGAGPSRA